MNRKDLSFLLSRMHSGQQSVLSVYLSVDQSRRVNLNRGFETQFKTLANATRKTLVDARERERFASATLHVKEFLEGYAPSGKSLVLFFDVADSFFWHGEVDFPMSNKVRWGSELFLQPLVTALDQFESYGVVAIDRAKCRLFIVTLGKIREIGHEQRDTRKVRHIKTAGTDHAESSSRIQRKADNSARENLRAFAKKLEAFVKAEGLGRIVMAGHTETTAEFRSLLPARLATAVIGEVTAALNAASAEILSAAQPVADNYERTSEFEKANNVVTMAAKKAKAVVGLSETLRAVNSDRIWELVYSSDLLSPGYECTKCFALFSARPTRCTYCHARLQPVNDIVERAVEHALRKHAKIEVVTGEASALLKKAGGIGAFLKARTGTVAA